MIENKNQSITNKKNLKKDRVAEVANTFEWLITAFILAFVFRAFVMEAYRIPTGSMAETLMGAHFHLRCPQCGYEYDYGFVPQEYGLAQDTMPRGEVKRLASRCPSCGYFQPTGGKMQISNGDRILVLKCIYQFQEPKPFDVIVFKDPLNPQINYIKRLIGLPGQTIEIIDGDVYIDGKIRRKPPKVQNELWMSIYDNDYRPVRPLAGSFNGHPWKCPLRPETDNWKIDPENDTQFVLSSSVDSECSLNYDTSAGNDFKTSYAYNDVRYYGHMPQCSDLMMRFYVCAAENNGKIGIALSKYRTNYKAWVDLKGEMVIAKAQSDGSFVILAKKQIQPSSAGAQVFTQFANVDHQLIFQFGEEQLEYDLGLPADSAGAREPEVEPGVKVFGAGNITVSHIAIFRDIHYTATDGPGAGRASEGHPLKLGKDEFFVLGDNSPNSADSRWWNREGIGNNGIKYRKGIVPREYLVGKAMFVYWSSAFKPFQRGPAIVPNIGKMRFIYGGSDHKKSDLN